MTTAQEKADAVASRLLGGAAVFKLLKDKFDTDFLISEKPMSEWITQFRLKVPMDNLTPSMVQELGMKVMELNQEASFHLAASQALHQYIKRGGEIAYLHKFNELIDEFKSKDQKLPASATLDTMAKINTEDEENAVFQADVSTRFWKLILEDLSSCRKILETASFSLNAEMRLDEQQRFAERMHRNGD